MGQSLIERFKIWMCDTFGHKPDGNSWHFGGMDHVTCKRCGYIVSTISKSSKNKGN